MIKILSVMFLIVLIPIVFADEQHTNHWGYNSIEDSAWSISPTRSLPLIQGGMSPDIEGMKLISIWHYLEDETDPVKSRPSWKFGLYMGGTETDPTGAEKITETKYYRIPRPDGLGSGNGWQGSYFIEPIPWPANTPTWLYLRDYNGDIAQTWEGHKVPNENFQKVHGTKGWFFAVSPTTAITNPFADTLQVQREYGKAYAVAMIFEIEGHEEPPPEDDEGIDYKIELKDSLGCNE